jgi:hypothetical protein
MNIPVRRLYRWVDRGDLDAAKLKGNRVLTDEEMNNAKQLREHDQKRKTLMKLLTGRGRTKDAAKKPIRGLARGESLKEIAARRSRKGPPPFENGSNRATAPQITGIVNGIRLSESNRRRIAKYSVL